jgi:hypothetical protein
MEDTTMLKNWQDDILMALAMLGAGVEGVGLEMT